ncbi:hypothetical protein K474DRAFT_1588390 [Panus rudis PR-1116 ss-1]|nr:hypothetical protein K474DRAFT_1588390 [Panus rudis PR-1116 ss-1]
MSSSFNLVWRISFLLILPLCISLLWKKLQTVGDVGIFPAHEELKRLDALPREDLSITYVSEDAYSGYQRIGLIKNNSATPDTTAVILNWSRFSNVRNIAALLCGPWLDDIISEVYIWNNNPKAIAFENFNGTGCSRKKLNIYNSPQNLYFQARFFACRQASTPLCFIQDDDYLVRPEVITSMHAKMLDFHRSGVIHLLPPHEHLSSSLREIHVSRKDGGSPIAIHTSFAWLGHGTMMRRSKAVEFLELMGLLDASTEEMKMADNYFTILSNRVSEIWFDQGLELGGGEPFTVGSEGVERNNRHILRAAEYLESVIPSLMKSRSTGGKLPYVNLDETINVPPIRAACRVVACMLETNIPLLPNDTVHTASSIKEILSIEKRNVDLIGESSMENYLGHPPSFAVDGDRDTFFQSLQVARSGEYIQIDMLHGLCHGIDLEIRMSFLTDAGTVDLLQNGNFQVSDDSRTWVSNRLSQPSAVLS